MKAAFHNLAQRAALRCRRGPSCDWIRDRLIAFADWDLPIAEFRAVERHLQHCSDCAAEFHRIDATVRELRGDNTPENQLRNQRACAEIMAVLREHDVGKSVDPS